MYTWKYYGKFLEKYLKPHQWLFRLGRIGTIRNTIFHSAYRFPSIYHEIFILFLKRFPPSSLSALLWQMRFPWLPALLFPDSPQPFAFSPQTTRTKKVCHVN